jgi:hypothetical protein
MGSETQSYKIQVLDKSNNLKNTKFYPEIERRYSEFEELFKALWSSYPGVILPQLSDPGLLAKYDIGYTQNIAR